MRSTSTFGSAGIRSLMLAASLAIGGCTVDDDVVEGKTCYPTGTDPNKTCMKGYECKCEYGQCICKESAALRPPPLEAQLGTKHDPSRDLLRRLGLTLP